MFDRFVCHKDLADLSDDELRAFVESVRTHRQTARINRMAVRSVRKITEPKSARTTKKKSVMPKNIEAFKAALSAMTPEQKQAVLRAMANQVKPLLVGESS